MHKLNQKGVLNPLVIPLIVVVLVAIGAGVMALRYYGQFVDQRDNNQPKIDAAVTSATETQKVALNKDFAEREKQPNKTYSSPAEFGSVHLQFPKTWSSYVVLGKTTDIDVYAYPNYVPSSGVNYALRMSVTSRDFASYLKAYDAQVKKGDLKATSIQNSGTTGTRLDGFLDKTREGSMVIFPLRDKTLSIWTESKDFKSDFDNIILKNLSFVP